MNNQKKHIIAFIDDEVDILENYSFMLQKKGIEVHCFSCGNDAIDWFKEHLNEVDLIISDFHMPNGNGHNVAEFVKEHGGKDHPMMFFLSGYTSVDIEERGWNLGYELIRKPIKSKDLMEMVLNYLSGKKSLPPDSIT